MGNTLVKKVLRPPHRCLVPGCRFPWTHTTPYHCCGKCKEYGHGARQCGDKKALQELDKITFNAQHVMYDPLPQYLWCTFPGCPSKKTHTLTVHLLDIQGPKAINIHSGTFPDKEGTSSRIRADAESAAKAAVLAVLRKPGTVCAVHYGHGHYQTAWNDHGKIHFDTENIPMPKGLLHVKPTDDDLKQAGCV